MQRCLSDDAPAQRQFYERFAKRMLGVCFRYAGNIHEAEDLLQEGFIKAFSRLKDFRGEGSLEGWLRRIMVTTALNFLKRERHLHEQFELNSATEEASSGLDAIKKLEAEEVMSLIQQLSPGYRAVLNLFVVEGYSHKEIGDLLGINESTSRSQFTRARQLLQKMIVEKFSFGIEHERTRTGKGF